MSSFIWGKPDGHTSMKYADQPVGFVEPASFVTSHWHFGEEVKEGILDTTNGYSDHIAPTVHGPEDGEGHHDGDLTDGEYGEIEIIVKFRGRTGSSIRSRKLKLTSNPNPSLPTVLKMEQPTDDFPQPHRVYSTQRNQSLCVFDDHAGCVCGEFSPVILRELLRETISSDGLSIDASFDHLYSCAVSDFPSDEASSQKHRKVSNSSGKKRLLSNASEEHSQVHQPNKKNPRLAAPTEAAEENDGDDNGERHTCPYFKMYPERHLECGTKDLAQRPKIKSHIIKDHLKKSGIPIPPEIKSQKCEPWDRWCKWIVQDSSKSDRPVPNSTPDFYPILNYIVAAASEIPSDGLTCFSSVILRLFKSVQANPNDWVSFITGLEELEKSLNTTGLITGPIGLRRAHPAPKEEEEEEDEEDDDKLAEALETEGPTSNRDTNELGLKLETSLPTHCNDLSLAQFPTSATSTTAQSLVHSAPYQLPQHPTSFPNLSEPSNISLEDFAHSNNNVSHLFHNPNFESMWFDFSGITDTTIQQETPATLEPEYYEQQQPPPPPPPQPREEHIEPAIDHLSVPPGIGTNAKSLVRAAVPPRVRKRKHGTVRSHRVEGAVLNDSAPLAHVHQIQVSSPMQVEKYEFTGQFSVSNFLEWLRSKFDFQFENTDGRKLHCRDVREDIAIDQPDSITAHLRSWSTKGVFVQMPEFWIDTTSSRSFGMEKYSTLTPALVEMIQDGGIDMDSILLNSRPGSSSYR